MIREVVNSDFVFHSDPNMYPFQPILLSSTEVTSKLFSAHIIGILKVIFATYSST